MSAVFFMSEDQKRLALESKARAEARIGRIQTPVLPLGRFYKAEDYHQKYHLRQHSALMREFAAIYPDPSAFADSTAAARVNGYLAGDGSRDVLLGEIDRLGLSADGRRELLRAAAGH
jgi:peptide-methionine (S)-S-oxide reductase